MTLNYGTNFSRYILRIFYPHSRKVRNDANLLQVTSLQMLQRTNLIWLANLASIGLYRNPVHCCGASQIRLRTVQLPNLRRTRILLNLPSLHNGNICFSLTFNRLQFETTIKDHETNILACCPGPLRMTSVICVH